MNKQDSHCRRGTDGEQVTGVRQAIAAAGASLLYLPPYSPDLNPIEQLFAQAQGAAAQGRRPHQGRALAGNRPPACQRAAQRMRQLSQPLRLWFHVK
jgi:DDE superfamily endonuclease